MAELIVDLNIAADVLMQYYQGAITTVSALTHDGRNVRFPLNILRPFVTHYGIQGRFIIHYADNGKFQNITQIS